MLIDTHAHLNFAAFKDDIDEVAQKVAEDEMKVINIGSQYSTSQRAVKLAERYPNNLYASVGLHPIHLFALDYDESEVSFKTQQEEFNTEKYEELAQSPKVVAIGETGIDYFHVPQGVSVREFENKQRWAFLKELQLAKKLRLPVIFHCRGSKERPEKAYKEMLKILKDFGYYHGVIHCFSADYEIAKQFLSLGFLISFTGIITYPKTDKLAEVVKKVPLDRIMVETDAPYLSPQIVRGKRNEPRFVRYIADRLAEIKGISYEEVEEITTENAIEFFGLK